MSEHLDAVDSQTQHKWNARYQETASVPQAAHVLWENQHLLPATGRALDLACGLGGNALLLAAHGLDTWAWDISDIVYREEGSVGDTTRDLRNEALLVAQKG